MQAKTPKEPFSWNASVPPLVFPLNFFGKSGLTAFYLPPDAKSIPSKGLA
jgi:hypothetical protein